MLTYLTPGIYFERSQPQVTPLPLRTDVAGFVGISERGPLHQPQRLTNWREFQQVFGGFLSYAYLAYAVHAFFENGGQVCWVVRVAATEGEGRLARDVAHSAKVEIPDEDPEGGIAYLVKALNPGTWGNELSVSVQAASLAVSHHVAIQNLPADQLAVVSVSGFEKYSMIRLTQAGVPLPLTRTVTKVDAIRGILHLDQNISNKYDLNLMSSESAAYLPSEGKALVIVAKIDNFYHARIFDASRTMVIDKGNGEFLPSATLVQELDTALSGQPIDSQTKSELIQKITSSLGHILSDAGLNHVDADAAPIRVESLEFKLMVWQADQLVERFDALFPNPNHPSRYAVNVVNNTSVWIRLKQLPGKRFPKLLGKNELVLRGGTNGLRSLSVFDYIGRLDEPNKRGLAALAEKDEVSILAIPDLTSSPRQLEKPIRAPCPRINECNLTTPGQRRTIQGRIVDPTIVKDDDKGLIDVEIRVDDGLKESKTQTDKHGQFELLDLLPGQIELLITRDGYEAQIVKVMVKPGIDIQQLADVLLTPIEQPSPLGEADIFYAQSAMVQQCEQLRDRVAILDPPWSSINEPEDINRLQAWRARFDTAFAALYYPWLVIRDPLQPTATSGKLMPACGHISGIYAATDLAEGVFRPPANKVLQFVEDVGSRVDDALQGVLNPKGINVIRAFPGRGIRVFGARTLSSNMSWRFVNVRRLMNFVKEAIYDGLQWAVFEPNNEQLWFGIRLFLTTFLDNLWRQGALVGDSAEAAYQVRCDAVTMPPEAQAAGQVIAEVSVAPTIPYEFIVFRLGLTTDELQISEVSP